MDTEEADDQVAGSADGGVSFPVLAFTGPTRGWKARAASMAVFQDTFVRVVLRA